MGAWIVRGVEVPGWDLGPHDGRYVGVFDPDDGRLQHGRRVDETAASEAAPTRAAQPPCLGGE